jgi:hypothetical protein
VRENESVITIIALALSICLTLALVFGNFSLAYLVKLFSEGRVPASNAFFAFALTTVNVAVLGFLTRLWLKTIRTQRLESTPLPSQPQRQNSQQRWQEAREKVLELAQMHPSFDVQQVMEVTEFNRAESEYLLDELLAHDMISVTQEAGTFKYSLKTLSSQKLSKVP